MRAAKAQEPPDAAVLPASAPALIPLEGAVDIAAGEEFSCAVLQSGGVVCWGSDDAGQLGNGPATGPQLTPVAVAGLTNAVAVTAGGNHACALTTLGTVLCWGANGSGQLGNDSTLPQTVPVPVTGLSSVVDVTAGGLHTCALTATGAVFCWGSDSAGQLGDDITIAPKQVPVAVSELTTGVRAVAAGELHTCALLADFTVRCWGSDSVGQLGNGAITGNQPKPIATSALGAP
ncbi:MAG: RCC1 domain-containing protein, partial [Caldilineaceae bacterium]